MARGKRKPDTYEDYLKLTVEEIKQLTRKKQRLPAMAFYVSNEDLSINAVGKALGIPEGTINMWAKEDGWATTRNQIKEEAILYMREQIKNQFSKQLYDAASNHLVRMVAGSNDAEVPITTMGELKANVEILEKIIKIMGSTALLEEPSIKVEHSGEVTQNHDVSKYEEHMAKFGEMLKRVEEDEE